MLPIANPVIEDAEMNGLLGAIVSFFVKDNLQKTVGGLVAKQLLTQPEGDLLVSAGLVVVKLVAKLQAVKK